tara:strand:+ start:5 stop:2161 length:2157 start_codon:yes stop_codon:yes gene_type:complete
MFRAAGGGASKFPDLSGDGKVTQKDILIGRGVIEKQEGGGIGAMMAAEDMAMMPDEMPSPMMQEPPMDPLAQDVLMAREEGEKIGLDYLAETMGGIDMAANTEELINAIRGNDRPLEARVAELATFVGEADARQTPESVLTMVQPTIMMTEEGAIDSGVGGLIAQVIGDTEMEDDMSQGVGSLMAQGQPEPMATPQQFAEGGAVKKFNVGGGAFQQYYDQYLPIYENLLRDSQEDRDKDRGLALARAGFQLASGRDAKGRNIAGSGFLSNLASAGETLIGDISDLEREKRKEDAAARTLALQSAFATQTAEQKAKRDLDAELFKSALRSQEQLQAVLSGPPKVIGQTEGLFGNAINVYGAPSVDEKGKVTYEPISFQQAAAMGLPTVDTPEGQSFAPTSSVPIGQNPDQSRIVTAQPDLAAAYAENEMTPEQQKTFEDQIQNAFPFEREKGNVVFKTPISSGVVETVALRLAQGHQVGLRSEYLDEIRRVAAETAERDPSFLGGMYSRAEDPESEAATRLRAAGLIVEEPTLEDDLAKVRSQIAELDVGDTVGGYKALVRDIGGSFDKIIYALSLGTFDPQTADPANFQAYETLSTLASENLILLLDAIKGRENLRLQNVLESTLTNIKDREYDTPSQLLASYKASRAYNDRVADILAVELQKPGLSADEKEVIDNNRLKIGVIGGELDIVIAQLEKLAGVPVDTDQPRNLDAFRRKR